MNKYKIIWTIAKSVEVRAKNEESAREMIEKTYKEKTGSYIAKSSAIIDVTLIEKEPIDPLKEDGRSC